MQLLQIPRREQPLLPDNRGWLQETVTNWMFVDSTTKHISEQFRKLGKQVLAHPNSCFRASLPHPSTLASRGTHGCAAMTEC